MTTLQRIEAYKHAIVNMKKNKRKGWEGICNWLRIWMYGFNNMHQINTFNVARYFPEFKAFKPNHADPFWFSNDKERMVCLELCILMAEDELKNEL